MNPDTAIPSPRLLPHTFAVHDSARSLLITGATGFLGLPCTARAVASGYRVRTLARSRRQTIAVPHHSINLFDADRVTELVNALRPRRLLHLAWIAAPGSYLTSPENETWVRASRHLLRAFAQAGGERAVIAGTCLEYDWSIAGMCHETRTPVRPTTLYGQCKNELRLWAEDFAQETGVGVAWARLFFMYGPHEHPARLTSSVARALLAGQPAECTLGFQQRDFLHTHDIASALVKLLGSTLTGPVNIGTGTAVTVREVIERLARICGRPDLVRLGARPAPPGDPELLIADPTRLRDELGWSPRITLEAGLRETVDWWRARHAA